MIITIFEAIGAYLLADLMTGVYHLATDRGWNIGRQVEIFQQHHAQTEAMVLDLRSLFLGFRF